MVKFLYQKLFRHLIVNKDLALLIKFDNCFNNIEGYAFNLIYYFVNVIAMFLKCCFYIAILSVSRVSFHGIYLLASFIAHFFEIAAKVIKFPLKFMRWYDDAKVCY